MTDEELHGRLVARKLTLDGTDFVVSVDRNDALRAFIPLARHVAERAAGTSRLLVGAAGPPGAGKSVTALVLSALLDDLAMPSAVVPLDGFHYPNAYLDTHEGPDHSGAIRSLRALKGWHATFDGERAAEAVRRLRTGERVSLPLYSRVLHDPVENALVVAPDCRVVIVEGNWLFLDLDPWRAVREQFDVRVFVTAPVAALRTLLRGRHMRGGRSEEEARRKIEEIDIPNVEAVLRTATHANVLVEGAPGHRVMHITT